MPITSFRVLLLSLLLLPLLGHTQDQTRYITDNLDVPLRSGGSPRNRVKQMLPVGTSLTVIEPGTRYSQVRLADGAEGWVLNDHLSDTIPDKLRIQELQELNTRLNEQLKAFSQPGFDISQLVQENQQLAENLAELQRSATRTVTLIERNKALQQQVVELEQALKLVEQENLALVDDRSQGWFLRGAGVLLLGLGVGVAVSRLQPRHRSRWNEL